MEGVRYEATDRQARAQGPAEGGQPHRGSRGGAALSLRPLHPVTAMLLDALDEMQDEWHRRGVPTPSSAGTECLRQLWFMGRQVPRSNRAPAYTVLALEQGKAEEEIAYALWERLGFQVTRQVAVPAEAIACAEDGTADGVLRTADGDILLEIKRLGAYPYYLVLTEGVEVGHPRYYTQVQLYLAGLGLARCFFLAVSADYRAFLRLYGRRFAEAPPPVWVEEIVRDDDFVAKQVSRNRMVRRLISSVDQVAAVPRVADPAEVGDGWPCGWCGWRELCLEAGGETAAGGPAPMFQVGREVTG